MSGIKAAFRKLMKLKYAQLSLAAFALTFAALAPAQTSAKQVEKEVRALDAKWNAAAKTRSAAAFCSFYAADAVVLPPNEPIDDTPAKVKKMIAGFFSMTDMNVSWTISGVKVAKGLDLAYCYGPYKMSWKDAKGAPVSDHGKFLEIWKKQKGGGWKCVADMFNSDVAAQS